MSKQIDGDMKVLVIGSGGFFGSWLVPGLERFGHEVVPFDLKYGDDLFVANTLRDKMNGCDAVVLLAAIPHMDDKVPPQHYMKLNVLGPLRVLEAMEQLGIKRLVYTSSGAIYGFGFGRDKGWVDDLPIQEETSVQDWSRVDLYGASKFVVEEWMKSLVMGMSISIVSLRINCIEPRHVDAARPNNPVHYGWWCSQKLAIRAYDSALRVDLDEGDLLLVNVSEDRDTMDLDRLGDLLEEGEKKRNEGTV